jgi:hypothetical protein
MNLEQVIQMLFGMMGNQMNSNLQPGMPMGTQLTQSALSMVMSPEMASTFARMAGPSVNEAMFGKGPMAGFGGMGSQYNYASRMTQYNQELFTKSFKKEISAQGTRENEAQYLQMMQNRLGSDYREADVKAGMKSDWQYMAIAGMNEMVGAGQVAYGVRDTATSMGYTFGAGFDYKDDKWGKDNRRILGNVKKLSAEMMTSYANEGYKYGNLTGRDTGDLIREMGKRGELNELGSSETENLNTDAIKSKIQDTSRSISGIRDIIKGSIPEVLKQLESAFGGESINTMGIGRVAQSLQKYRQLSETTGTSLQDMMQYAQGVGAISQQVAGYNQNSAGGGLTVSAFQAAGPGDMRGIDSSSYARTTTQRVAGAQLSETSLLVSGALARLKENKEDTSKFKAALDANNEPLTASSIAKMAGLTTSEVISSSKSRAARDIMSEDNTGTYAALGSSKAFFNTYRADILKRGLRNEDGTALSPEQAKQAASMTQRQLETKYGAAQVGNVTPQLDQLAESAGFANAEEQTKFYNDQDRSKRLEKLSGIKATWAKEMQMTGGSISSMIRNAKGGGGMFEQNMSKSLNSLFNIMTKEGFVEGALGKELNDTLGTTASADRVKKFVLTDDKFKNARGKIVEQEYNKLFSGDPGSPEFREQMKAMQEPDFWKKKEEEYKQTVQGSIEMSGKGKDYDSMKYDEKKVALRDFAKERAQKILDKGGVMITQEKKDKEGKVIINKETGVAETEQVVSTDVDFDAMRKITGETKSKLERKDKETDAQYQKRVEEEKDNLIKSNAGSLAGEKDEAGKKLLESGPSRDMGEILQQILDAITGWMDGSKNKGTGDKPTIP